MKYSRLQHVAWLNKMGYSEGYRLDWFEEWHPSWVRTPSDRMAAVRGEFGSLMRKHDPVMFNVSYDDRQREVEK